MFVLFFVGHKRIINPTDEKPIPTVTGPTQSGSDTSRISIKLINLSIILTCYLITLVTTRHWNDETKLFKKKKKL